jgi:phosphoglycerate kinase
VGLRTLHDLGDISGKVVGVRADLNVPLDGDRITDDGRIRAVLPTLEHLASAGATIVVFSHLGRPQGAPDQAYTLAPVAARLGELWSGEVRFVAEVAGQQVTEAVAATKPGDIIVTENLRFDARETSSEASERADFAALLAAPLDAVVIDGFGVVHRKQASVYELPGLLPSCAGLLVEKEVGVLSALTRSPERPYTVVLGGSKVSDKLGVIDALLPTVNTLVIGGGMVFTILAAKGMAVGGSLLEADQIDAVTEYLRKADEAGVDIVLPTDIVMAEKFAADAGHEVRQVSELETGTFGEGALGLDIGPESAKHFADVIARSKTVLWNGPMGVSEMDAFAAGTKAVAQALSRVDGLSVVGGGDSAAAVRAFGYSDTDFGHISTGGGASLEFLEGKALPGLEAVGWK